MEHDEGISGDNQPAGKRKGLNLDLLFKPAIAVVTSVGTLYLYGLRTSDLSAFTSLTDEVPIARIRSFLPNIASLVEAKRFKDERPPLSTEEVGRLTDVEVEKVAEAYAEMLVRAPRIAGEETANPERQSGESAATYLDRLLKREMEEQGRQFRRMQEKMLTSTGALFSQVRSSSQSLGSTLNDFDRLTQISPAVDIRPSGMEHIHAMDKHLARKARERDEELEMVRLTGKMTAESAKTLKDLAEAATFLLEQLDERDKRADHSTRKQIAIAVWSVGVSAVLALLALIVSGFAYIQDKANIESGDRWQTELVAVIREGNRKREATEEEARSLRQKVAELEAKISGLPSSRDSGPLDKRGTSVGVEPRH